jgi:ATP-dependent helicase/nuclease subunit A
VTGSTERTDEAFDAQARRRIRAELDKNFLVEAAAGTGKTTSIVDRMVNLVASNTCQIEQLAAVTFTRKAAAELRERFQAELRRRAGQLQSEASLEQRRTYLRLQSASDCVSRAFVGTIHSFCAAMLRERPIEFGVDPAFRELDEEEDQQLREQAWQENITDLFATGDPLIDRIDQYGLDRTDLKSCFDRFIQYRDVPHWPYTEPPQLELAKAQQQTRAYVDDMRQLLPLFPADRGNDKLMGRYEAIVRGSGNDWSRPGDFFQLLEKFDTSPREVQGKWHDRKIAKRERDRFKSFRQQVVGPALEWWRRKRYRFVVDFVRRAVEVYERQKTASGGLDFTDLLLITTRGLQRQPELRRYFQDRFTHLLVDEFQDTDPIQAGMILYLTSEDKQEQQWQHCQPRPGSLFLVGDPKQSIYRFRRGDIVTYNRVKAIFEQSGGEVLSLVKNFRCCEELRSWNNQIFRDKFLPTANQYTTAAEDMVQGRVDASPGELRGIRKLTLDGAAKIDDATMEEAEAIARFIRHAIDSGMTVPRRSRDSELGLSAAVQAQDFLIITRFKKRIGLFKDALDRFGIPCQVTGGNAFSSVAQLGVLIECLRAIDDPHNAVHYLAILRERLFAFSDAELYEFKRAGGRFSFLRELPEQLVPQLKERFAEVNSRLRRYQLWLRTLPFSAAVHRIAADLGLLAGAAAGAEGDIALGGFLKALDVLRQHHRDFDSASDLIGYLDRLETMEETEGCTALPPESNVVRVMNLHKAKGLEAPIVFLADTSALHGGLPICHIDRSGDEPVGYMGITKPYTKYQKKEVATPAHWKQFQDEEDRFLRAEHDRLLYVATTRAGCMLVVSVGNDKSNWSGLYPYLQDAAELDIPASPIERCESGAIDLPAPLQPPAEATAAEICDKWSAAARPSYAIESVKHAALQGRARPNWQASGDYGYQWGSVIHELLEITAKAPTADLRAAAVPLVKHYDLGSERIDELLATVSAVTQSQIWQRSRLADRCYTELPLEIASQDGDLRPLIIRGVIDLIFAEPDGWVVVDYKTDDITAGDIDSAVEYYRPQLVGYADHWQNVTGDQVKERGLYFTRLNSYVKIKN